MENRLFLYGVNGHSARIRISKGNEFSLDILPRAANSGLSFLKHALNRAKVTGYIIVAHLVPVHGWSTGICRLAKTKVNGTQTSHYGR
jgi:hypothetical protein